MDRQTKELLILVGVLLLVFLLVSACSTRENQSFAQAPACTVAPVAGGQQITCPDGTAQTLLNGAAGAQGSVGDAGPMGEAAQPCSIDSTPSGAVISCPDGSSSSLLNGTIVTPVQFCSSGFVPTYPSTFPEYGLTIGGAVYGVYSTNGGFLALLPPGTYSSNGVGASCTFTINSDNSVTQD